MSACDVIGCQQRIVAHVTWQSQRSQPELAITPDGSSDAGPQRDAVVDQLGARCRIGLLHCEKTQLPKRGAENLYRGKFIGE